MTRNGSFSASTRALIIHRDEGRCQWCGRHIQGQPYSLQHRIARGMGGTRDPRVSAASNGITMCGTATTGCHGLVESNRLESAERGFTLTRTADPETVEVVTFEGHYRLFNDGTRAAVDPVVRAVS